MQAPSPPLSLGLLEEASYTAAEPSFDTQSDPHSDSHSDPHSDTHSDTHSDPEPTDAICTPQRKRPGHPLHSETDTTVHFGNQCPERLVSKLIKTVTDVTQTTQTALQTTQTALQTTQTAQQTAQTAQQTAQPNEAQEFRPFVLSHSRSPQQLSGIRCVSCMSRLHGFADCDLTLCKYCLLFHRPYTNCRSQRQTYKQSRQSLRQPRQSLRSMHDDKNTPFDSQRLLLMRPQPARKEGASPLILSLEDTTQQERQWCTDTVPEIQTIFRAQNSLFNKKHWRKKKNKGYRKWR
jgi:hypothetical protein